MDNNGTSEINSIKEVIEELIKNYKSAKEGSKKLMDLSKALYILDNWGKVSFDGYIRLEAGYRNEEGNSSFYVMSIYSDEIVLCEEGYDAGEFGGDSFYNEYYNSLNSENDYEAFQQIEEWKETFYELSDNGTAYIITDQTEALEISDSEEE